jgi:hypothetical protein
MAILVGKTMPPQYDYVLILRICENVKIQGKKYELVGETKIVNHLSLS